MGRVLWMRWGLAVGVGAFAALSHVGVAVAQGDLLSGWKVSRNRSLTIYTPTDLQPGEAFSLVSEPPAEIGGEALTDWLAARVDADVAKLQSESGTDGAYTLDGYSLTLKYRDGRVERRAFAFMDTDGTKDAFYSNGNPYLLKDKK